MRMTLDELINAMEPQARKDKALISKCVDGLTEYAAELRQKAGDAGKEQISALRRLVDELAGYWCDHGWWEFDLDRYSASLSATMRITPDNKNPTAGSRSMKSGYGVNQLVTTDVSSTQSSATTPAQNAVSYFSEFNHEMFWRLLEQMGGGYNTRFEFQKNEYSTYRGRTHFTPIWYPNGSYTVNTWLIDCWTPAGMLSMNLSDSLTIRGSLWDDWHIAPLEP